MVALLRVTFGEWLPTQLLPNPCRRDFVFSPTQAKPTRFALWRKKEPLRCTMLAQCCLMGAWSVSARDDAATLPVRMDNQRGHASPVGSSSTLETALPVAWPFRGPKTNPSSAAEQLGPQIKEGAGVFTSRDIKDDLGGNRGPLINPWLASLMKYWGGVPTVPLHPTLRERERTAGKTEYGQTVGNKRGNKKARQATVEWHMRGLQDKSGGALPPLQL